MKHEVTTLYTKKALAASLKGFMEKKPLSKITVSEIIASCGLNRKTFYYHFSDIYDLLKWMLEAEAIEVVRHFDLQADCKQAILFVMDYVRSNKHLLCCAYDSMGREEMKRFFYADFSGILCTLIDNSEESLGLEVAPDFKVFLSQLFSEAVAGMLIEEFTGKETHTPQQAAAYLSLVLESSLPGILKNAPRA